MGAKIEVTTNRERLYDNVYNRKSLKKLSDKKSDREAVCRLLYEILNDEEA